MSLGRWTQIGALVGGAIGGVVGLVVGLGAYPPTAWFAVVEVGIPAAIVGGALGLSLSSLVALGRAWRSWWCEARG